MADDAVAEATHEPVSAAAVCGARIALETMRHPSADVESETRHRLALFLAEACERLLAERDAAIEALRNLVSAVQFDANRTDTYAASAKERELATEKARALVAKYATAPASDPPAPPAKK